MQLNLSLACFFGVAVTYQATAFTIPVATTASVAHACPSSIDVTTSSSKTNKAGTIQMMMGMCDTSLMLTAMDDIASVTNPASSTPNWTMISSAIGVVSLALTFLGLFLKVDNLTYEIKILTSEINYNRSKIDYNGSKIDGIRQEVEWLRSDFDAEKEERRLR